MMIRPDRPNWVGFVCWVLIISGMVSIYQTMKILATFPFQHQMSVCPYPPLAAEVIFFGGLVIMVVSGICIYEGQGWARYVYLLGVIPIYVQCWLIHAALKRAELASAAGSPGPPHHDFAKYLLILEFIGYLISIWILFTKTARRYFNPPMYVDED